MTTGATHDTLRAGSLGFGCAELFRLPSARQRRRVLDAALDAGIEHYDVAPMYGLGRAEGELGRFARGHRDRVVIATKFGIDVTRAGRAFGLAQGPVRRLLERSPALRARVRAGAAGPSSGTAGGALYVSTGYGAAAARASLERSLRALGVDHVDLLLLHDPPPGGVVSEAIGAGLETLRAQELIGTWGVAGEPDATIDVALALDPAPPVVQVRDDVLERALTRIPRGAATPITFGSLGSALARITVHLRERPDDRRRWSDAVGSDCGDPEALAPLLLRHARLRNPDGITLFSTTRTERLAGAVTAAGDAGLDAPAATLAALVEAELGAPPATKAKS